MIDNLKKFLNEEQDPKAIEKIASKLNGILMNGEEVEYIAVQKKPAVNLSPDCVALTNKRIIFCRPKNLGLSMEFQDYIWKNISDCHLKEGILGAEFTIKTVKGEVNKIDYLPKTQARKLYTVAQEQEEIQKEIRRQIDLEDKRASAENISVNANVPQNPQTIQLPNQQQEDPMIALQKLKALLENELITQTEFDTKKADILSRI
ncbi:PH domain-containing protein [Flavobacterium psychrophilum]|uniref:PH domain-containing protein n=1 Tax=Flavobacterium psychrophilum TaxID=96345 RepID=UPI002D05232F|nr:PH domain-containing protein [Flavobacterium psychrophilum]